jgi:hypothetical protein
VTRESVRNKIHDSEVGILGHVLGGEGIRQSAK